MHKTISKYQPEDKKRLEEAFLFKEGKKYEKGLLILHSLEKKYKNDKAIIGLIATFYFEKKDFENSVKYFRKSTKINPSSELASLGYFHSLYNSGKIKQALTEIGRFISSNKYDSYTITIKELKQNITDFNAENQKMILSF